MIARPYEPPPDYPMVEDRCRNYSGSTIEILPAAADFHRHIVSTQFPTSTYRSHSIDASATINRKSYHHSPRPDFYCQQFPQHVDMLRTRHVPEIAGIYQTEEQPCLRRFTRYNQSIKVGGQKIGEVMQSSPSLAQQKPPGHKSMFTKKPLSFMGNWTFRDKNKTSRANICDASLRATNERPQSMNLSNLPDAFRRSKSGDAISHNRTSIIIGNGSGSGIPRNVETRVPIRIERMTMKSRTSSVQSPSPSTTSSDFKTNIRVEDDTNEIAILRPKKENPIDSLNNNNSHSFQSCVQLRKSCPDLESAASTLRSNIRISQKKRKTRRAHEKTQQAAWRTKPVKEWCLDDVLLWLQSNQMDEIASLLIGYDLRGVDLLEWNDATLIQLGVADEEMRTKLMQQLDTIIKEGPQIANNMNTGRTLFDLVKQTSYDQVLAVETPLTTRDITVTHGRLGCLQITKVNGANLPLREHDCLLEINERSGEQFKSALMLTKLISDSSGSPIRFVVLRRKIDSVTDEGDGGRGGTETSSGISSSPPTPKE